jgi:hypothetical protein
MSTEKQNNSRSLQDSWKVGLDQINIIPGQEPLDRELAWGKLYGRLKKQHSRRKYPLYWFAAASLLSMAVFSGIRIKDREILFVQKQVPRHDVSNIESGPGQMANPPSGFSPVQANTSGSSQQHRQALAFSWPGQLVITDPDQQPKEMSEIFQKVLTRSDFSLSASLLPPIKKSLRIVSLNESIPWSDPYTSPTDGAGKHFFKIKIYNPGNLFLPSLAEEQPVNDLINIRFSSQN